MTCSCEWCRDGAAAIADVVTPDGRKLKPLCEYHLGEFETGLKRSRAELERMIAEGAPVARLAPDDYLSKLEGVRILTLEEGLEAERASPGLLVVPEDGGGDGKLQAGG